MKNIIRWLKVRMAEREAKAWLGANNPARCAAEAMFRLNRHAFVDDNALYHWPMGNAYIYGLKNRLVEVFYHLGYCVRLTKQRQVMECWSCLGTGWYNYHVECYKCDGTGVYRLIELLRFEFRVGGRRFVWHQPKRLVMFTYALTDDNEAVYTGRRSNYERDHLTDEHALVLSEAVRLFIAEYGYQPTRLAVYDNLLVALRNDVYDARQMVLRKLEVSWSKISQAKRELVCRVRGHMIEDDQEWLEYCRENGESVRCWRCGAELRMDRQVVEVVKMLPASKTLAADEDIPF